ncbi:putative ABC transporter ATP-binding protein YheS [Lentilactobacillus sunkii]|jgi:lincosamide and streptogramin A transport system ATP-binding/permease protein|uniref:Putative ABC transporter ATP-binding protein YheS n=1 Tax=Lentilactobacillus sunkii TaxID=481719 RepID=A0A1E7XGB3_9LACO|nr:ATP-binding cassette domain-containing protein [Lentilactobacillus sunkii]OFA12124.1 putative ABC transporter ATP-binding protein YheS [Lentilactobacillus sunkii]
MGTIQVKNLSYQYLDSDQPIFHNLSVDIDDHWRLGLIGRNGRGKTTFLKLLLGNLDNQGAIKTNIKFSYFPAFPSDPSQSVMDVMTSTGGEEWQARIELEHIGIGESYDQRPFESLSGGEQTRVLLARRFMTRGAFPLIDEPTNHLDISGRKLVGQYLRSKSGFICVSHDESFLNSFVDHVMSLNRSSVDIVSGSINDWKSNKEIRDHSAVEKNIRLRKSIKQLDQRANQQQRWAEQKERESKDASSRKSAKKMMKRVKAFKRRASGKSQERKGLLNDIDQVDNLTTNIQSNTGSNLFFSLRSFSILRNGSKLFSPINVDFHENNRLALYGPNGVGKTTLIQFLQQKVDLNYDGYQLITLPKDIGYLSQNFESFVRNSPFFTDGPLAERTNVWNIMHQLGVSRSRLLASPQEWSMGETKKAALAYTLTQPHTLLIWDEPTNYLDISAREQLINLVKESQPSLILIDHDEHFIRETSTQQVELRKPD